MSDKLSTYMSSPKVSIIIATCNCSVELEQTIISFIEQDYENKELIVVDCESTDETSSILKKYALSIAQMLSEKDTGISDAFNKGIKLATGDYINFQGSGDLFNSNNVLAKMMKNIDKDKDLLLCGRVKRVANDPEQSCLWVSEYIK
ncbi:glycosyltransferase, partial [sulfur-oxidizing endosymbiont of Gigantopelta aegis]|uniref:glycosyltransferase n=1 Tax=sulfur-oxidizing endosymbiont of Gigantopelta aegis TaxID=2794934 RepID=UPI0018DC91EE